MDKRMEGESFEDYKKRMKFQAETIDTYLKGQLFWPSSVSGTWCKADPVDKPTTANKKVFKI